jgi:hypothetical protein
MHEARQRASIFEYQKVQQSNESRVIVGAVAQGDG